MTLSTEMNIVILGGGFGVVYTTLALEKARCLFVLGKTSAHTRRITGRKTMFPPGTGR